MHNWLIETASGRSTAFGIPLTCPVFSGACEFNLLYRRLIEPVIGWCKDVGGLRRTRFLGRQRIQDDAMMVASAWNLMRMATLT